MSYHIVIFGIKIRELQKTIKQRLGAKGARVIAYAELLRNEITRQLTINSEQKVKKTKDKKALLLLADKAI